MSTKNPDGMMLRRDFYFYQQATVAALYGMLLYKATDCCLYCIRNSLTRHEPAEPRLSGHRLRASAGISQPQGQPCNRWLRRL